MLRERSEISRAWQQCGIEFGVRATAPYTTEERSGRQSSQIPGTRARLGAPRREQATSLTRLREFLQRYCDRSYGADEPAA